MSKESPLSHHEQLRYDYLFKNIHYLNDREKREFDYLKRKMDGELPSNEREKNLGKDIGIPQYSNQSRSNRHQKFSSLPEVKKKNSLQTNTDLVLVVDYMCGCRDDFHVSSRVPVSGQSNK